MGNEFFDPGAQRAAKVDALFAHIAKRYDLINDLQSFGLHRWWKRRVVSLACPAPGTRALDLCCGTGDIAFALARRGAEVIGLDFNAQMLAVAEQRRAKYSGQASDNASVSVSFRQGDAQAIPFGDQTFDIVTVGYGLRNLTNWKAGLSEMARVAKPGGRLLVLDFGKPDNAGWRALYFGYLKLVVPLFGLLFCGSSSAYAYILESLRHYPAQRGVAAEMTRLGLARVGTYCFLGGAMTINCAEKP